MFLFSKRSAINPHHLLEFDVRNTWIQVRHGTELHCVAYRVDSLEIPANIPSLSNGQIFGVILQNGVG